MELEDSMTVRNDSQLNKFEWSNLEAVWSILSHEGSKTEQNKEFFSPE